MPRVNRLARAEEHPNPIVGCIMILQEKIKFLGRTFLRCQCPEYEAQLVQLREDLSTLREQYQTQRMQLRRLQLRGQESLQSYRARINSLLQVNATRVTLRIRQEEALRKEIMSLRWTVWTLGSELRSNGVYVESRPMSAWVVDPTSTPFTWRLDERWVAKYPNEDPGPDPNDVSITKDLNNENSSPFK